MLMKRVNRLFGLSMGLCIVLLVLAAGCAKKAAEPALETVPPSPKAAPAPVPEVPQPEAGVPVEGVKPPVPQETVGFDKKIYFDFDKFELKAESVEVLNELAAYLKANPGIKATVEGHCDERGTNEYNLALGERRAKAAYDYLVSQGVDESRLETISYGEEKPVDPGHNEEAWAKNRRAQFVLGK
jgi:peptidoglycan-associated lipoprotein